MTTTSEKTLVNYTATEGIAVIELTNPPANTYSHEMMRQLDEAILRARFDDDVHVIVIRGEGEKFFCAGAEISMFNAVTPGFKYYFCLHANETLDSAWSRRPNWLSRPSTVTPSVVAWKSRWPVISVSPVATAGKVGLPEINLGVLPGTGGTQRLARALPKNKAIEFMVEGKLMSFEQAQELDLINYIYESENYWEKVMEYAKQFCPPNKASKTVGRIKRSVQSGAEDPLLRGPRHRTRTATTLLPERRRQRRYRRLHREAQRPFRW